VFSALALCDVAENVAPSEVVIPAKAGIALVLRNNKHGRMARRKAIPAFAGMTARGNDGWMMVMSRTVDRRT
jgi:hypothetical protein